MKQRQHHPPTRAPHGKPKYTSRFSILCTPSMRRKIMARGGSDWLRQLVKGAP